MSHISNDRGRQPPKLRSVSKQRSFPSFRSISALVLREMSTTYGKSPYGYMWAVVEPVASVIVMVVIFSAIFRSPPIGTNFAMFYATGVVPFLFYMGLSAKISQSIGYSQKLLAYPAVTFLDALIARIFLNAVTQLLVMYIIFMGIYFAQDTRTDPQVLEAALSFAMALAIAIGIGTINCFLMSAIHWWTFAWAILNRPMFLISCIFFVFDSVPLPYRDYLWYNPLIHVVGQMRKAFYPSYGGDYVSSAYVFGVSLTLTAIGLALLARYHRDLIHS